MFRRSASLAIPHLKSFAAIPFVSLVQLGHTNRNVFLSHESQCEIALIWALSRPIPNCQQGEVGERHSPVFRNVCVFDVSQAIGIARFESVSESQPNRAIQCHQAVQAKESVHFLWIFPGFSKGQVFLGNPCIFLWVF